MTEREKADDLLRRVREALRAMPYDELQQIVDRNRSRVKSPDNTMDRSTWNLLHETTQLVGKLRRTVVL